MSCRTVGPLAAPLVRPVDGVEATRARVVTALASIVDLPVARGLDSAHRAAAI